MFDANQDLAQMESSALNDTQMDNPKYSSTTLFEEKINWYNQMIVLP